MNAPRLKYIVVERADYPGLEFPVVFPEALPHVQAAGSRRVLGAGFCSIDHRSAHAWGASVGLGIKSRGETDAALLQQAFCSSHIERVEATGLAHAEHAKSTH